MRELRQTIVLASSSTLIALAPKCPICFLAYFGIFGAATAATSAYRAWLAPITAIWLALTIAALAMRAGPKRRYGVVAVGLIAAASIFSGKYVFDHQGLIYGGLALLVAAVIWSSWPASSANAQACACASSPQESDARAALNKEGTR